jgi:hypothetical protein
MKVANPLTWKAFSKEMTSRSAGMGVPGSTRTGEVAVAVGRGVEVGVGVDVGVAVEVGVVVGGGGWVGTSVGVEEGVAVGGGLQPASSKMSSRRWCPCRTFWTMITTA